MDVEGGDCVLGAGWAPGPQGSVGWGLAVLGPFPACTPWRAPCQGAARPGAVLESDTWGLCCIGSCGLVKTGLSGPMWWDPCSEENRDLWGLGAGALFLLCSQEQVCLFPFGTSEWADVWLSGIPGAEQPG